MEASALTHAQRRGRLHVRSPLLRLQRDDRLVALMRRGNEAAFEVLFERYRARLHNFCRHMLKSSEDAEDVLQEVFVAAYKAILSDEREINVRPWLYRIARNRSLNHLRRPVPDGQDTMDDRPFENGATTHDRVQKREEFRHLLADVGDLPETQKTALLLREIDAMSYEEIGAAMDTTIPSVKSLLVRARMSLAEATEARGLTCSDVRVDLAEAAEGISKVSGPIRRHVRNCDDCKDYRAQLRSDSKVLAALFPVPLLVLAKGAILAKLGLGGSGAGAAAGGGGGAAAVGGAGAAGSSAGSVAAGSLGSAIAAKATAGVVTAALITTGVVEMNRQHRVQPPAPVQFSSVPPPMTDKPRHHRKHDAKANADSKKADAKQDLAVDPTAADKKKAADAQTTDPLASTDATGGGGSTGGSSGITSGGSSSGGSGTGGGTTEPPPPACEPAPAPDPGGPPAGEPGSGAADGSPLPPATCVPAITP